MHTVHTKFHKELQDGSDRLPMPRKGWLCCRISKVYSTALKNTLQLGRPQKAKSNGNLVLLRYMSVCVERDNKYFKLLNEKKITPEYLQRLMQSI